MRDRSIKAVVHLEDAEDERFWNYQLQTASPANYLFLPYSKKQQRSGFKRLRAMPALQAILDKCVDTLVFASKHAKGMSLRYDAIFIRAFG